MTDLYLTKGLLFTMAWEVTSDQNWHDDLVQEGHIAAWQASVNHPGHVNSYYTKAVKRRMWDVYYRQRPMLGETSHRGHPIDPLRRLHESLDRMAQVTLELEQAA